MEVHGWTWTRDDINPAVVTCAGTIIKKKEKKGKEKKRKEKKSSNVMRHPPTGIPSPQSPVPSHVALLRSPPPGVSE